MGRRGPPPKPTKLKALAGNPGRRPLNQNEPMPSCAIPRCPEWLSREAKAEWRRVVPELQCLGLVTLVDLGSLASYCQAWAEFQISTKTLSKEGRTVTLESGYMMPHPAVAQQRSAWQAIKAFSALFGLDPSSRSRLSVPQDESDDQFTQFLNLRGTMPKAN